MPYGSTRSMPKRDHIPYPHNDNFIPFPQPTNQSGGRGDGNTEQN